MAKQNDEKQIVYVKNASGAINAMPKHLYNMLRKEPSLELELVSKPKATKKSNELDE